MVMSILEQCNFFQSADSDFVLNQHRNWQSATELPVADSDFVLESSNELATGI